MTVDSKRGLLLYSRVGTRPRGLSLMSESGLW